MQSGGGEGGCRVGEGGVEWGGCRVGEGRGVGRCRGRAGWERMKPSKDRVGVGSSHPLLRTEEWRPAAQEPPLQGFCHLQKGAPSVLLPPFLALRLGPGAGAP